VRLERKEKDYEGEAKTVNRPVERWSAEEENRKRYAADDEGRWSI
jgi:hypothetical protein